MIFAAGLGTRFKPWTNNHPKALAPVNGKPLLQKQIEYLQQHGVYEVVVNVHHFTEQIIEAVEKNKGWGSTIHISNESDMLLDTGGGILNAQQILSTKPYFITLNADFLTTLNLSAFIDYHLQHSALATLAIGKRNASRQLLFNAEKQLVGWQNTITGEQKMSKYAHNYNAFAFNCVTMYNREVLQKIERHGKFSLIDVFLDLAAANTLQGYDHTGDAVVDVGKPENVAVATAFFP